MATKMEDPIPQPETVITPVKAMASTINMETLQHKVLSKLKSFSAVLHKPSR
jgi:hypothetical protein